jgi:hypothetical protein
MTYALNIIYKVDPFQAHIKVLVVNLLTKGPLLTFNWLTC